MSDDDAKLTIGELAEATGRSTHTLRYYEDAGLIPEVARNAAGHRRYRPDHVRWVALLERLRRSGMSMARMRAYAELARHGDATVAERRALLVEHESEVRARIAELERCLAIVQAKIDLYDGRLDDPAVIWEMVARAGEGRARRSLRGDRGRIHERGAPSTGRRRRARDSRPI